MSQIKNMTVFSMFQMVGVWLHTFWRGRCVGTDEFNNRYFCDRLSKTPRSFKTHLYKQKRWVLYAGEPEASRIPPEWHAWLHYQTDQLPQKTNPLRPVWIQPHQENLTGTDQAWRPLGHTLRRNLRPKATGDYEAWSPEQK